MDLSANVYAHMLGLTNPYVDYMFPDPDDPSGFDGSGLPPFGGNIGGGRRRGKHHYHDVTRHVGSGFFDDLVSSGKKVYEVVKPHLLAAAQGAASGVARSVMDRHGQPPAASIGAPSGGGRVMYPR